MSGPHTCAVGEAAGHCATCCSCASWNSGVQLCPASVLLELVSTRLYVAHYQAGVRVLDVSVPETPREVAHYNTFRPQDPERGDSFYDGAIGIRVPGDGYVYAVDTSRGLLILKEE